MNRLDIPERVIAKFNRRIDKTGPCWMWLGQKDKDGYGKLAFRNGPGVRHYIRAHRLQVILTAGYLDEKAVVLHLCDTPGCVNPGHLQTGTHIENEHDKLRKKRNRFGDRHQFAVLRNEEVRNMILGLLAGGTLTEFAKLYKVNRHTLQHITAKSGGVWKSVWDTFPPGTKERVSEIIKTKGERAAGAKLTEAKVVEIRRLAALGMYYKDIGTMFNVSCNHVCRIVRRSCWAHVT